MTTRAEKEKIRKMFKPKYPIMQSQETQNSRTGTIKIQSSETVAEEMKRTIAVKEMQRGTRRKRRGLHPRRTALEGDETVAEDLVQPSSCLVLIVLPVIVIEFCRLGIREGYKGWLR